MKLPTPRGNSSVGKTEYPLQCKVLVMVHQWFPPFPFEIGIPIREAADMFSRGKVFHMSGKATIATTSTH